MGIGVDYPAAAVDDDGAGRAVFDGTGAVEAKAEGKEGLFHLAILLSFI